MMTPERQAMHDEKLKRIEDAIALKEPDRVPIFPSPAVFPILNAGYTVAQAIYDPTLEIAKNAFIKYLNDYDPDAARSIGSNYVGEGHLMEMTEPKNMRWAGMPGNFVDDRSIQQYIEFPLLLDEEFDEFWSDRTGWSLRKASPRVSRLLEPLANFRAGAAMQIGVRSLSAAFSTPEMREMIQTFWKIEEGYAEYRKKLSAADAEVAEMGYPYVTGMVPSAVPFDSYSDGLRGTILSLYDLYDRPEDVQRYIDEVFPKTIAAIRASKGKNDGKHIFMALHKGVDGFMGDEYYEKYYWRYLREIIDELVKANKVPYVFCEGKYNTRLNFLTEVPKGKVFYYFEDIDLVKAKKILGDVACISGGFSTNVLTFGTVQQTIDQVKACLDICAPGGGFIFNTACGLGDHKIENVHAMFDTVKSYGTYR